MNCKIIEDLLPLYHDGLASDESRALVEEHLETCERCRLKLAEIGADIKAPVYDGENSFAESLEKIGNKLFQKK